MLVFAINRSPKNFNSITKWETSRTCASFETDKQVGHALPSGISMLTGRRRITRIWLSPFRDRVGSTSLGGTKPRSALHLRLKLCRCGRCGIQSENQLYSRKGWAIKRFDGGRMDLQDRERSRGFSGMNTDQHQCNVVNFATRNRCFRCSGHKAGKEDLPTTTTHG